jgi:hypothetical protein
MSTTSLTKLRFHFIESLLVTLYHKVIGIIISNMSTTDREIGDSVLINIKGGNINGTKQQRRI